MTVQKQTSNGSNACWTLVAADSESASFDPSSPSAVKELQTLLEKGNDSVKIETMKKILSIMMNGGASVESSLPALMMPIIRFVLPSKNKSLKKLLFFYWEVCPKYSPDGKLKQEMILVCNYIRNDLQSSNEYIRGMSLRFLCKLRDAEILEPLIPSVRSCLEHRHAYVRKNAILAIYSIYTHLEHLLPDAPELVYNYLLQEADPTCRRNGFMMLCNTDTTKALAYLQSIYSQISSFDEFLQLAVIEFIKKDCHVNVNAKRQYIDAIGSLLTDSSSAAVKFDAADTLLALTTSSVAVKEVAKCYIELCVKESDNNVKLVVLEKLKDLRKEHEKVLGDLAMDILRILSSPDLDVCRKAINIVLDLLSRRNSTEILNFLKKEITKTHDSKSEKNAEYRLLLLHAIHQCAIKFPEIAASVVHVLMEFLDEGAPPQVGPQHSVSSPVSSSPAGLSATVNASIDVIGFLKEVIERNEPLRMEILSRLISDFCEIKAAKVFRGALWILGEYCHTSQLILDSLKEIRSSIGDLPIVTSEAKLEDEEKTDVNGDPSAKSATAASIRRVLPDGTYATESAISNLSVSIGSPRSKSNKYPLRNVILTGGYFTGAVLASSLTKLVLRLAELNCDKTALNAARAEAMLIMTSVIRVGHSPNGAAEIDEDSHHRVLNCLRILAYMDGSVKDIFLKNTHDAYSKSVQESDKKKKNDTSVTDRKSKAPVEQVIEFKMLRNNKTNVSKNDTFSSELQKAIGLDDLKSASSNRLSRIFQLTGFSDPVYAEAFVDVHQYDVLLDVLIVNQTAETLRNLAIEFSTMGDLKLVERPAPHNMGPYAFYSVKTHIKVSSSDTGLIFGNIVYDGPGALDTTVIGLDDIRFDIIDYIAPSSCTDQQFRSMWTEFEWENRVNVHTNISDLKEYLQHLLKNTNMRPLVSMDDIDFECGFLAVNLYARSIFGEDALANVCVEKPESGPITGHIRIRCKTQGIALSLGDKISRSQTIKVA